MDKIKIKDLEVFCNHGVYKEETVLGQKFVVNLSMFTEMRRAGKTDDLEYSVDYGNVSQFITDFMKKNTFKLIEAVAESLAEELLLHYPLVKKVRLEVKKPWAPVHLPLDTVSVEIERGWHMAYIAIGSNMGDKEAYLNEAVESLKMLHGCEVLKVSDYIVTEPYGGVEQDEFLNGALLLKTLFTPYELLDELHVIEQSAGRERIVHWGPRTLDLDILFYDDMILDTEELTIPHAEIALRDFVLEPMDQIAPCFRHPVLNKTIRQLRRELNG